MSIVFLRNERKEVFPLCFAVRRAAVAMAMAKGLLLLLLLLFLPLAAAAAAVAGLPGALLPVARTAALNNQ